MRTNSLKRKLAAGHRVCGVVFGFNNPELLEVFGHLGFDFAYIDGQHGGLTIETARSMIRAADATGMTSIVRVPRNDASVILEYLDAGAGGIIVPNVNTRLDVDAAVMAMKYPPLGQRGGHAGSRAANYGVTQSAAEYFEAMNDEVLFVPLVEDRVALEHLDDLCSAPGVDVVGIGPSDLALSMGIVGGWSEPPVQHAVEQIRAAAAAAGKPSLGAALDAADARRLYEQGFQAIVVGASSLVIGSARTFLREIGRT